MIHPIVIKSNRELCDDPKARKRWEIIREAKRIIMERSENIMGLPHEIPKVYY